ncbi:MAG: O-antigen ligase family protein [Rhodocyclales bacterium]|nr:O-antigen ligase family protein [Rhodocyclales bacterium]
MAALCLLSAGWTVLWLFSRCEIAPAVRRARWALAFLALWCLWIALQLVALPAIWIHQLSPKAYEIHALTATALNSPLPAQLTLSLDPHATLDFLMKSVAWSAAFTLTLLLVNRRERVELLLKVLVICGTLQALYGSVMVLSGLEYGFLVKKVHNLGVATGSYVNRNHLAGYLNICLAAGIGLMIARLGGDAVHTWRQRLRSLARLLLGDKARLRIYLIVMVIGLVLTRSRMGNTAFFAGTLIVGALGLLLMRNAPRSTSVFLASLVVLDLLIVGTWFGVDQVAQRIQATEVSANAENVLPTEDRDDVDRAALPYLNDFRLTGSGGGTFYVVFPGYHNEKLSGFYDFAHNDYVQIAAETGAVGLLLCGSVVLGSLWQALVAMRRRRDPLMRGTAFGVTMAICWLLIHSAVDFNAQMPATSLTIAVVLALAWIASGLRQESALGTRRSQAPGQPSAAPAQGQPSSRRP